MNDIGLPIVDSFEVASFLSYPALKCQMGLGKHTPQDAQQKASTKAPAQRELFSQYILPLPLSLADSHDGTNSERSTATRVSQIMQAAAIFPKAALHQSQKAQSQQNE